MPEKDESRTGLDEFDMLCSVVDGVFCEGCATIELKRENVEVEGEEEASPCWSVRVCSSADSFVEVADPQREVAIAMAIAAVEAGRESR